MIALKEGLDLSRFTPIQSLILQLVHGVFVQHGYECVITDAGRRRRADEPLSLHHVDRALDFRLRHIPAATAKEITRDCRLRLGPSFDCLDHGAGPEYHLHVEYDPKE